MPRLVYAFLHVGVVVHQLLKERLECLFAPAGDLIRQAFERGATFVYLLLKSLGRTAEIVLGQVHRPLLNLSPGFLDALVQLLQSLRLSLGH